MKRKVANRIQTLRIKITELWQLNPKVEEFGKMLRILRKAEQKIKR